TAVSTATGLAQNAAQYSVSAWPAVAVAGGALIAVQSVLVLVFARSWAVKADKYSRSAGKTALEPKDASSRNVSSWEQLSDGEDPTADPR
ncbi:Trp biosynthesis-associated membrane protein, partial [Glutamicibacter protophormiae]|uniref:Trp biosynthesis-associated membrane protein n=1 Tax=Glutamicibacter protophormiae TaxID=37930 RepID=UPI003BAE6424